MVTVVEEEPMEWERARRFVSWVAGATFAASFVGLLVLSASSAWTPENPWVGYFDQAWKASGLAFLAIAALPYGWAILRRLRSLF